MTIELLHEALNGLDDALVEEVAALRVRPRRMTHRIAYPVAIAACFCIMSVVLLVTRFGEMWQPIDKGTDGEIGHATDINTAITEIKPEDDIVTEPYLDGSPGSTTTVLAGNAAPTKTTARPQTAERPTALVRITRWKKDGFVGVVTGAEDTDVLKSGDIVTVQFAENIGFEVTEGDYVTFYCHAPTEEDFPVDSVVKVRFKSKPVADQVEDDAVVLYAEGIGAMEE